MEMGAIYVVPQDERLDTERSMNAKNGYVYQLTGIIRLGDEAVPYLHMNSEAWESLFNQMWDNAPDHVADMMGSVPNFETLNTSVFQILEQKEKK